MSVLERHIEFVEALRAAGLPVSLAEDLDSVRAAEVVGIGDRDAFRAALRATLLKRETRRTLFDAIFDIYYPPVLGHGVTASLGRPPARATSSAATRAIRLRAARAPATRQPS